jgi:hypothetical protein
MLQVGATGIEEAEEEEIPGNTLLPRLVTCNII